MRRNGHDRVRTTGVTAMTDVNAQIVSFVKDVVSSMGLTLDVAAEEMEDGLRVNLSGEDGEVFIRRKGDALDALQNVVNTAFRRHTGHERRIVIDCLDFRKVKDAELRQMAAFLVDRAKQTGTPQEIGPLNPYARRIVHLAVAEDPDAASESVGDAFMKTVIISARGR